MIKTSCDVEQIEIKTIHPTFNIIIAIACFFCYLFISPYLFTGILGSFRLI